MKPYKKYKTTAKSNFISGYSTMCVILIAFFLMFSVLASAMANKSSLAGNIIAQEDSFEAALIPRPRFAPDNVVLNNLTPWPITTSHIGMQVSRLANYLSIVVVQITGLSSTSFSQPGEGHWTTTKQPKPIWYSSAAFSIGVNRLQTVPVFLPNYILFKGLLAARFTVTSLSGLRPLFVGLTFFSLRFSTIWAYHTIGGAADIIISFRLKPALLASNSAS